MQLWRKLPVTIKAAPSRAVSVSAAESAPHTMVTLRHVPEKSLHLSKPTSWLTSRFHFSFAEYFDPSNAEFGALRVMNDDLVKGKSGFPPHPHRDYEIFSYVVDGKLSHQDSMGNKEALGRGSVQYMSAGRGVVHSEMNEERETCRFIQTWIKPDRSGHDPQYGSQTFDESERKNKLLQILGGTGAAPQWGQASNSGMARLHQDVNVFASELDADAGLSVKMSADRQAYLLCIEGSLRVATSRDEVQLSERDAVEIVGNKAAEPVEIKAGGSGAHLLMVEMKKTGHQRRGSAREL